MNTRSKLVVAAGVAGVLAFAGDFLVTLILGLFYPDYSHLKLVMSELGTASSPVAVWMNLWWIVYGILILGFALGFQSVHGHRAKALPAVTVLIVVFGAGAGIAVGIFPMDAGGAEATVAGRLHDAFAGLGFLALAFLPLILAILLGRTKPLFRGLSVSVFVLGMLFLGLFVVSEDGAHAAGVLAYAGLWQRLFLLNHYLYLGALAVGMFRTALRPAWE